ncbi:MAG TPA: hypothetical protein VNL91_11820 [Thermoanaerobaculia bacterium]|nr:hypothetical protein [Thermoanaerobaculia bacterium]
MRRDLLLASLAVAVTHLATLPRSTWEFDETLFFRAIHQYDPVAHHPPPPGYPLFAMFGHLVRFFIPDDFATLVAISTVASIAGFVLLAAAFIEITGDRPAGIWGAILFHVSPAMLVHATLPISDPGALALYAAAIWSGAALQRDDGRAAAIRFGLFAALTVGWRPQMSIAVVPLLFATLVVARRRLLILAVFTAVCVLWLIPLALVTGGAGGLIAYETQQASYLAEHDADVSRSHWTATAIALRFIAHPWGTKLLSLPLLMAAAAGGVVLLRRRTREAFPIVAASAVYLGVALAIMDPADGVRYSLPATLGIALCAGSGLAFAARRIERPAAPYAAAALFAAGSFVYVASIVGQRGAGDSPPVRAARWGRDAFPKHAVALYELPLWPHATYLLADYRPMRVDRGLAEYYDRPDVPLFIYADGASRVPGAQTFRWAPSDAYSKLTRNHYRVASIIPLPPHRRFRPLRGVHAPEREPEGDEWRWLDRAAEIALPRIVAGAVTLTVGLPGTYPREDNMLTIETEGAVTKVRLERGRRTAVTLPLRSAGATVRTTAAHAFVPAELPGSLNRDPRSLAVKLYDLSLH